ncbi:MAG: DUF1854 domain-containing protein [Planctomycetes bacterium]|nr:DUF1854 domain-containing protein [Planctomycetota bacterium]
MIIHLGHGGRPQPQGPTEQNIPSPKKPSDELRFLAPRSLALKRVGGRLQLQGPDDREWRPVSLAHLFPLSEPEAWISVLDKDGNEVGILQTLRGMTDEALRLAREELHRRYVVPQIRRVMACRERFDLVEWKVETDRGPAAFLTRGHDDQVQQPLPNHFSITDIEGNRYDIPDLRALDPASRALLEGHL